MPVIDGLGLQAPEIWRPNKYMHFEIYTLFQVSPSVPSLREREKFCLAPPLFLAAGLATAPQLGEMPKFQAEMIFGHFFSAGLYFDSQSSLIHVWREAAGGLFHGRRSAGLKAHACCAYWEDQG